MKIYKRGNNLWNKAPEEEGKWDKMCRWIRWFCQIHRVTKKGRWGFRAEQNWRGLCRMSSSFWEMSPRGHILRRRQGESSWKLVNESGSEHLGGEWEGRSITGEMKKKVFPAAWGNGGGSLVWFSSAVLRRAWGGGRGSRWKELPRVQRTKVVEARRAWGWESVMWKWAYQWPQAENGGCGDRERIWKIEKGSCKISHPSLGIQRWCDVRMESFSKEKSLGF